MSRKRRWLFATSLLAICCGVIACSRETPAYWSPTERSTLASLQLERLQPAHGVVSNRFANDDRAASFGEALFFDTRLSLNDTLSCGTCHQPELAFTDGKAKAEGIRKVGRNTQTLLGVAYLDWFYWDGRKDSLWAQALVPFEAADEMAASRLHVLRVIAADDGYRTTYEALFGPLPDAVLSRYTAPQAGPWGDSATRDAWYRITPAHQTLINRAYANVGKAVAAYERSLPLPQTRLDRYLSHLFNEGSDIANQMLTRDELAGLRLFMDQSKTHCLRCHNGPLLTNGDFHDIGTGNFEGEHIDFGRFLGIQAALRDEFNCVGAYSDAQPDQCLSLRFLSSQIHTETQGAFKTPTLRYLNRTAPFFHDGRFATLEAVLDHYERVPTGETELPALKLTPDERRQLVAFLGTLALEDNTD